MCLFLDMLRVSAVKLYSVLRCNALQAVARMLPPCPFGFCELFHLIWTIGCARSQTLKPSCITRNTTCHCIVFKMRNLCLADADIVSFLQLKDDEELGGALDSLDVSLKENIQMLSSFEKYKKEVLGDSLDWTPMHTSLQVSLPVPFGGVLPHRLRCLNAILIQHM